FEGFQNTWYPGGGQRQPRQDRLPVNRHQLPQSFEPFLVHGQSSRAERKWHSRKRSYRKAGILRATTRSGMQVPGGESTGMTTSIFSWRWRTGGAAKAGSNWAGSGRIRNYWQSGHFTCNGPELGSELTGAVATRDWPQ